MPSESSLEVLIIGAGISGIGAGIELLRRGNHSFALIEAAHDLGGTWRDNTYPGIAVDIASISYCFPFETDYPWSREFAEGAEIQRYVKHCADKYRVTPHIRYGLRAVRSTFDNTRDEWETRLDDGTVLRSRFLVAATGLLSQPKLPDIPGLDTFAGKSFHTARWDHTHDLRDRHVAIIGTGASAVQIIPEIAPVVRELHVFQRTPIWISPRPDRRLKPDSRGSLRRIAPVRSILRLLSETGLEFLTFSIVNYQRFPLVVKAMQRGLRFLMRRQVDDSKTAEQLLPDYGLGCKRPSMSNTYLPVFNRNNVQLVTNPIARICAEGVVTRDDKLHQVDTIILATGFLTTEKGNAPSFEVIGSDGVELGQFWEEHRLQAYAGVSVPGFPNFFLTAGPYSGGFNWFTMLDAHLRHILSCMDTARTQGATRAEVKRDVHGRYMQHMWQRANGTVFKNSACASANSYYLDRHGDASLPLPHTPWWRVRKAHSLMAEAYRFSGAAHDALRDQARQGAA